MFLENPIIILILAALGNISCIFTSFLLLKINTRDPFYINKKVHIGSYVACLLLTLICFFLGIIEYSLLVILLQSAICLLLAINDTISNRLWISLTLTLILLCEYSIFGILELHFEDLASVSFTKVFVIITIPSNALLLVIYYLKYHTSLINNLLNKFGITIVKIVLLISVYMLSSVSSIIYYQMGGNLVYELIYTLLSLILCTMIWYVLNLHKKVTDLSIQQETLLNSQKEYYLSLLEKEEETRRYRHDMNNHLMCLSALLKKDDIPALSNYLSTLQDEFKTINGNIYQTGNTVLTAITAHYLQMVDENTVVNISGKLTKDPALNNTDMCAVYSNLIKNAIEELERIDEPSAKELNISFDNGNRFGKICISNSMKNPASFEGLASKTVKKDKKNHGYGIQNVSRIIAQNKGSFNIKKENSQFCCEVIFPVNEKAAG